MLIEGKKIAELMLAEIRTDMEVLGEPLKLATVLVGESNLSKKFLELKGIAARKVGIDFELYSFPEKITTQQLRKKIVKISKARTVSGVIIELPLPSHINTQYILNAVPEEKDPDVLSQKAQGSFYANRSVIFPPSVEAIRQVFDNYNVNLNGKNCAVFGYGILVGKPISHWLAMRGATVSIVNEFTLDPKQYSLKADIIISGVGKPNLITADMINEKTIIIDFAGDVDYENIQGKASLITPPRGGIGPIVIASVLKNIVVLNKNKSR